MCSRCWRLYQTLLSLILPAENMDVLPRRKGCDGLGFGRKKKKKEDWIPRRKSAEVSR